MQFLGLRVRVNSNIIVTFLEQKFFLGKVYIR